MNVSRFRTAVDYTNFEPKLKTGMVLGGFVEIPIGSSGLMLQPEFLYSQMGSRGSSSQDGAVIYRYNYFSIPLELKYKCHSFMFLAGPQADFLVRARLKNYFGTKTITNDVQDFDCGFTVGAEYWFNKHWVTAIRYTHGIMDSALPDETNTFFNQGLQINVGYKLFKKVKKPKKEK
jgi:Outer membrane protein beta-barrel domain